MPGSLVPMEISVWCTIQCIKKDPIQRKNNSRSRYASHLQGKSPKSNFSINFGNLLAWVASSGGASTWLAEICCFTLIGQNQRGRAKYTPWMTIPNMKELIKIHPGHNLEVRVAVYPARSLKSWHQKFILVMSKIIPQNENSDSNLCFNIFINQRVK